jgi:hypothetical protein
MKTEFDRKAPTWPTDPEAVQRVEKQIELGNLGELPHTALPGKPRYLVTYMKSNTAGRIRSATVVSVTNQSPQVNRVFVSYFRGLTDNNSPVCVSAFAIPPDYTIDFCSRALPSEITTCNAVCQAELVFDEGRAIVSSMWPEIGVSSRVYYTSGDRDEQLLAITDSKIVVFGEGNKGD